MSSKPRISARGLGKSFKTFARPQDRFWDGLGWNKGRNSETHRVLEDISFDLEAGEVLGILGVNGAGKSTLLSLLCGILAPDHGSLRVTGEISPILDLGVGFDNELTGRENLFLVGSMRRFSRVLIQEKLEEIHRFSGIGSALDRPVKSYSTGMYMRLAFSLVVHLDPEILVIDEALAVGDEAFQSKCYQRLRLLKEQGVSIVFVSHSSQIVQELCDRALLLDAGELICFGDPKYVIAQYHKLIYASGEDRDVLRDEIKSRRGLSEIQVSSGAVNTTSCEVETEAAPPTTGFNPSLLVGDQYERFESRGARIHSVQILDQQGASVNLLVAREQYYFSFQVDFDRSFQNVRFGMLIKSVVGTEIGGRETSDLSRNVVPGERIHVKFGFLCNLTPSTYFMNAGVLGSENGEEFFLDRVLDVVQFQVLPNAHHQTGLVDFRIEAEIGTENLECCSNSHAGSPSG